eukprot:6191004-Pleurochrysis_carterae.AAC.2
MADSWPRRAGGPQQVDLSERPDTAGRAPPTPAAKVVERIQSEKAAGRFPLPAATATATATVPSADGNVSVVAGGDRGTEGVGRGARPGGGVGVGLGSRGLPMLSLPSRQPRTPSTSRDNCVGGVFPAGGSFPAGGLAAGNLVSALTTMPISHLSHVLASSHRALITGASWAVDSSEIQFGKRLGAGAYGE